MTYDDVEKESPIRLEYNESGIFLHYTTRNGTEWITNRFSEETPYWKDDDGNAVIALINRIFNVKETDMTYNDGEKAVFKVGNFDGEFYIFNNKIVDGWNKYDYAQSSFELSVRVGSEVSLDLFTDVTKNSIMELIGEITGKRIIIGDEEGDVSLATLKMCSEKYPSKTELKHYARSKITGILSEDLFLKKDYDELFRKYVNKRRAGKPISDPDLNDIHLQGLTYVSNKLGTMLNSSERYVENKWQEEILKIILYIYPQYIAAFRETDLPSVYGKGKTVDFTLIDANGYLDVLEIKIPEKKVISSKKDNRNNHTPSSIVTSTAIQIENYLFALNRWGKTGEETLTKRYRDRLPSHIESIKISNPRGIMIIGRSKEYNEEQIHALELVKRHYSRITDLVTYDDLISRLIRMIESIKIRSGSDEQDSES